MGSRGGGKGVSGSVRTLSKKPDRGFEKRHIGIFGTKGKPGTRTNTATTVMETIAGSLGADLAGRIGPVI